MNHPAYLRYCLPLTDGGSHMLARRGWQSARVETPNQKQPCEWSGKVLDRAGPRHAAGGRWAAVGTNWTQIAAAIENSGRDPRNAARPS